MLARVFVGETSARVGRGGIRIKFECGVKIGDSQSYSPCRRRARPRNVQASAESGSSRMAASKS